ncbi:hypothetical protein L596_028530 [Steinernema carpocapsae]|uniref:Homeobox domain-containing protein n=1 Tax=Steinernema carpocapsae TaxID=34508 RepID=A0A4U5LZN2_STECR|nr:hypothetical protein L596_028530 [Steinernema carpocapsae]
MESTSRLLQSSPLFYAFYRTPRSLRASVPKGPIRKRVRFSESQKERLRKFLKQNPSPNKILMETIAKEIWKTGESEGRKPAFLSETCVLKVEVDE